MTSRERKKANAIKNDDDAIYLIINEEQKLSNELSSAPKNQVENINAFLKKCNIWNVKFHELGLHDAIDLCGSKTTHWTYQLMVAQRTEEGRLLPVAQESPSKHASNQNECKFMLDIYEGVQIPIASFAYDANIKTMFDVFYWILGEIKAKRTVYHHKVSPKSFKYIRALEKASYIYIDDGKILIYRKIIVLVWVLRYLGKSNKQATHNGSLLYKADMLFKHILLHFFSTGDGFPRPMV